MEIFLAILFPISQRRHGDFRVFRICPTHDVPILVAARLLKPLGNPQKNGIKFFATAELLEQAKDKAWLVKVTHAINQHWQKNNAGKKNCMANGTHVGLL